jgi:hypothetical protein
MQNWFSCRLRHQKIDEHGKQVRTSETYLVEAINFSEAETRVFQHLEQYGNQDIIVSVIHKTNFNEIVDYEDGQYWYKAKVGWEDIDQKTGKHSNTINYFLVSANSVVECCNRINDNLQSMLVTFDIMSVSLTPILDVLPLFSGEEPPLATKRIEQNTDFESEKLE